jgi:uncharacterized protein YciI
MPYYVRTLLITVSPDDAAAAIKAHKSHLLGLKLEGRLRAAGAFRHGDGFLEIFEARDLLEAEAIARASPLVDEGLATWMLREWEELEL